MLFFHSVFSRPHSVSLFVSVFFFFLFIFCHFCVSVGLTVPVSSLYRIPSTKESIDLPGILSSPMAPTMNKLTVTDTLTLNEIRQCFPKNSLWEFSLRVLFENFRYSTFYWIQISLLAKKFRNQRCFCFSSSIEYWLIQNTGPGIRLSRFTGSGSTVSNSSVPQAPLYRAGILVVLMGPNSPDCCEA